MTGFYRTGTMFAINQIEENPDIICLSKGITGGVLPIGLTVATQNIFNAFLSDDTTKALLHGHSFTANPISCSAVCANLDLLEKNEVKLNVENIIKQHQQFAKHIKSHFFVAQVRQTGTILALEIGSNTGSSYFSDVKDKAYDFFTERGLLIRPLGNVIFLNPPYCITTEELKFAYQIINDFLDSLG
jgi:adenosylmethionine-8-amino-7-oxononanoate aminotransferase